MNAEFARALATPHSDARLVLLPHEETMTIASVPTGAVLAFAGELTNSQLRAAGWSVCDGDELSIDANRALFGVIGTTYGGDGIKSFRLPDYQGRFLRGYDATGGVDQDVATRSPQTSSGTTSGVGTHQAYATSVPKGKDKEFKATVPHVPSGSHRAYSGSNAKMLTSSKAITAKSSGGGNSESRPVNAYVQFIIKLAPDALIPVGTVIHHGGADSKLSAVLTKHYLPCFGKSYKHTEYPELYQAIKIAHGGDASTYHLPDYRGRFLRGVDGGSGNDPDAKDRTAMAKNGSKGDAVGSVQGYATGKPVKPFTISLSCGTDHKDSDHCAGHDSSAYNSGSVTQDLTSKGGDAETRPVNAGLDHYILKDADDGKSDVFPVGSIIAFPGPVTPDATHWLPCNGASVYATQPQYAELHKVIGHVWGCDEKNPNEFYVPSLNGLFLRGTDHGAGRDPDAKSRLASQPGGNKGDEVGSGQSFATAQPVDKKPITASIEHLPTKDYDNAAAILCSSVLGWGGSETYAVQGGDKETRPINVSVQYFIKIAEIAS